MKFRKFTAILLAFMLIFQVLSCSAYAADEPEIKNVIYMIGDGMGTMDLEWTKAEKGVDLFMDSMPYKGFRQTDSLSGLTDSAAGGTALACGNLTYNSAVGCLAISMSGHAFVVADYKSLTEAAMSMGKRTGVVTSDTNNGATPATFSVHSSARKNAEDITSKQLSSNLNLIWSIADGIVTEEKATSAGWTYIDNINEISNLPAGSKSFAQFSGKVCFDEGNADDAPLSQLTTLAINQLECDNGFFLMVEGAHIDKYSHNNDKEGMMKSLIEFDKAVENAVEYAEKAGNTLVVVSADHETGGITYDSTSGTYSYTTGDHTNVDVPIRVYGSSDIIGKDETIENVQLARRISDAMGYTGTFPSFSVNSRIVIDFFKALSDLIKDKIG